jgi:hypothetical protein
MSRETALVTTDWVTENLANPKVAGKFDGFTEAWSKSTFMAKSLKDLMDLTEKLVD